MRKRVRIQTEERLTYEGEIVVIKPEWMSDAEFGAAISEAEHQSEFTGTKELSHHLAALGLEVDELVDSFPDNPRSAELEIFDIRDVE